MKPTLGLTGLTVNAMALIAPGAFLWLTFLANKRFTACRWPDVPCGLASSWHCSLMLCHGRQLRRAVRSSTAEPAPPIFMPSMSLSRKDEGLQVRAGGEILSPGWASHLYYWVNIPDSHGGRHRDADRLSLRLTCFGTPSAAPTIACLEMYLFCIRYCDRRFLHRISGFQRKHGSQYRGQRNSNFGFLIVFGIIAIAYRGSHPQGSGRHFTFPGKRHCGQLPGRPGSRHR